MRSEESGGRRFALAKREPHFTNRCSLKGKVDLFHLEHIPASGNPVRIGDGCATVTGYEFPNATASSTERDGKAGARLTPEVRISAGMCSSGSRETAVNFSAKRRMRPGPLQVQRGDR
jgi:hypothetical protein